MRSIIVIDAGASKTLISLYNILSPERFKAEYANAKELNPEEIKPNFHCHTERASLTNDLQGAINTIKGAICLCLEHTGSNKLMISIGIAGAGNKNNCQQLSSQLVEAFELENKQLLINSDAKTSVHGALFGKANICIALGTGSVAMKLAADGSEQLFGGWGFLIGDHGGAACLGKVAVQHLINQIDNHGRAKSLLARAVSKKTGNNRPLILNWLNTATAYNFGQLAPLVTELQKKCPKAKSAFAQHITSVEQLIQTAQGQTNLPVTVIGGLASVTTSHLSSQIRNQIVPAQGTSLDGALLLALAAL
ncbi:BadF/BadG/BcrA/BcrD ATPase family protein [Colwellia piezophila]|uniref:BadF/BadG/BcrA/BcrD ATPase family protein n=1 Tax=Colwellia piezophila TaxID=211668 RepID=UPI0003664011|nr:BadF/BadG/BcrA/BcrD ATPase family protein [Colwellia piezophila]